MKQFKSRKFVIFFLSFIIGTIALFLNKIDGWVWLGIPAAYGIINTTQKFSGQKEAFKNMKNLQDDGK